MSFRNTYATGKPTDADGKLLNDHDVARKGDLFNNAMKANYYSRSGAASFLDRDLLKKQLDNHDAAIGDGSYTIQLLDPRTGAVAQNTPLNFGGRIYYPNAKDQYTIIDKEYLEIQLQKANEQEEYLNEVIELATASDKSLMTTLGITDYKVLQELCGKHHKFGGKDFELPESIATVDCLPSVMRLYPKESLIFAQAVAKMRAIILAFAPIMDTMGTKKAVRENTD